MPDPQGQTSGGGPQLLLVPRCPHLWGKTGRPAAEELVRGQLVPAREVPPFPGFVGERIQRDW